MLSSDTLSRHPLKIPSQNAVLRCRLRICRLRILSQDAVLRHCLKTLVLYRTGPAFVTVCKGRLNFTIPPCVCMHQVRISSFAHVLLIRKQISRPLPMLAEQMHELNKERSQVASSCCLKICLKMPS